jgi:NAD(P)-dependent dehydrogenase (short-subunit alcohol dehydrogenase family)
MTAEYDLAGRRALVTGAAGGLGGAIVELLVRCGARVAVNDLDAAVAAEAADRLGGACTAVGDITDEAGAAGVVEAAVAGLGGLDTVVNNAGLAGDFARTLDQPLEDWRRVMDVHVRGTFLISREAGRLLTVQRGGTIVNIGSITGVAGVPARNSYGVSKAAVGMLTQTLAGEWARYGIRVNCVAPGIIDAGLFHDIVDNTPVTREDYLERIPLGRLGGADDIARAVGFLLSDLSAYITGVVLPVDGGWLANAGPSIRARKAST